MIITPAFVRMRADLGPSAFINDALIARAFPAKALEQVAQEIRELPPDGEFITRFQASRLESYASKPLPVNLDEEPIHCKKIRYEIIPGLIRLTVSEHCPCIKK